MSMSDETTTVGGYPRGLRLSKAQDQTLRRWPLERIRPKSVALGMRSLVAEVDALRERVAALEVAGEAMHSALWDYWFPRGATPERDEAGRQAIKAWRLLGLTEADEQEGA